MSRLVGSVAGPSLQIDNNSAEFGATALRLEVEPDRPPMTVNSEAKVVNLNADRVDGLVSSDLLPGGSLPSGKTIRGHWILAWTADASGEFQADSISFGYTLASSPIAHFVAKGATPPPECPGSVFLPQAAPGHLCVYERPVSSDTGVNAISVCNFNCLNADRFGAMVRGPSTRSGLVLTDGMWAVTAP